MVIIGIDPGSKFCGYGLLVLRGRTVEQAGCDVIKLNVKESFASRLVDLHDRLVSIFEVYNPDIAVVEDIFFDKNVKSAFTLGHVRGVILFTLKKMGIEIFEYSPKEIKKSVVGNGNASKEQVHFMVKKMFNLKNVPPEYDATDALAGAICHFNKIRYQL